MTIKVLKIQAVVTIEETEAEAVAFKFYVDQQEINMADFLPITPTQKETVEIQAIDSLGADAPISGIPTCSAAPAGIVTLTMAADGKSLDVQGVATGTTTVTVSGVSVTSKPFSSSFAAEVLAAEAVGFRFTFNPPVEMTTR